MILEIQLKNLTAPIFSFVLLLTGFLIIIYTVTIFKSHPKYTSIYMAFLALILHSVATFDETYGFLRYVSETLFFVSIWITSIVNAVEKKLWLARARRYV